MKNLIEQSKELSTTSFIVKDGVQHADYQRVLVKIVDGDNLIIYTIGRANQFSSHSSYIVREKVTPYYSSSRTVWRLYSNLEKFEKAIARIENIANHSTLLYNE